MSTITSIEAPRRGSKRRRLVVDHEPWRETSSEVVAKLGLEEGADVELAEFESAVGDAEQLCAKDRALRLLSYRERSSDDLMRRLVDDGYPEPVASSVVEALRRIGFVDDARFASSLAHSRSSRALGRTRILRDLSAAGVDAETAMSAVEEALPVEDESSAALTFARRAAAKRGATVEKVASALVRRGYRPALAFESARTAFGDAAHDAFAEGGGDGTDEDPYQRPAD